MLSLFFILMQQPALADEPWPNAERASEVYTVVTDLGQIDGEPLRATIQSVHMMADYSETRIALSLGSNTQVVYEAISAGITVSRDPDGLILTHWGNRYSNEGSASHQRWKFDPGSKEFYPSVSWGTDLWSDRYAVLEQHLDRGEWTDAHALFDAMGTSPNGGHSDHTDSMFELFLTAYHLEALSAFRGGHPVAASDIASKFRDHCGNWWPEQPTPQVLERLNDLAFFLDEGGDHERAEAWLTRVVEAAPDRTVAWLNLADAEWALDRPEKARGHYETYLGQMTRDNRQRRIPRRVRERMNP